MKHIVKIFMAAIALWLFTGTVHGKQRSPFVQPADKVNPYNYAGAIHTVTLKGILRTEKVSRAIVQAGEDTATAAYGSGDKIFVFFPLSRSGLIHEFTLSNIDEKSVWFKGRNNRSYEVTIR